MYNVFSVHAQTSGIGHNGQAVFSVLEAYLDNMPSGKFIEVMSFEEADILFMFGNMTENHVDTIMNTHKLVNNIETLKLAQAIEDKPCIVWYDSIGPNVIDNPELPGLALEIRDKDFAVSITVLPPGSNHYERVGHIRSNLFKVTDRFERKLNSLIMMSDHFNQHNEDMVDVAGSIKNLCVTKSNPEHNEGNILHVGLDHPFGVINRLNMYEYVLSTQEHVGMELFGFEGGFCGANPIYPDNPYYRSLFSEVTGVKFFDVNNRSTSIIDIVSQPSDWIENHMQTFIDYFSSETNLNKFWNSIYDVLEARSTDEETEEE